MSAPRIDAETFCRRLSGLYSHWRDSAEAWEGAESICVAAGPASEDFRYLKSVALHIWLFGYELPDTILAITKDSVYIVASTKKAAILQPLCGPCQDKVGVTLKLVSKQKSEDGSKQIDEVIAGLQGGNVGSLIKEKPDGKLAALWGPAVASSGLDVVDVTQGLSDVLSSKDEAEIKNTKRACYLLIHTMKEFVMNQLENVIDDERKVKHTTLSDKTEKFLLNPGSLTAKLKTENIDVAYLPVFQSGGKYDLKLTAQCEETNLHEGVILTSVGARYSSYCANIARTVFVDATPEQEAQYKAVLEAHRAAVNSLVEGATMSDAHAAVVKTLRAKGQEDIVGHLTKNVGHGIGLELRESLNVLNAKNTRRVRAGMVFNVCVGVQGLTMDSKESKRRNYAIQIADTVIVQPDGKRPENCTTAVSASDLLYVTQKEQDEPEEEDGVEEVEEADGTELGRRKQLRSEDPNFNAKEAERKRRQMEILEDKNQETLRRLTEAKNKSDTFDPSKGGRRVTDIVAYKSVTDIPQVPDLVVQTDSRRQAVLLPIYGVLVPFHISTIKNVDASNQEGETAIIRIQFHCPGMASAANYEPALKFPNKMFIKELSFRTSMSTHASKVVQDIKIMSRQSKAADTERAERATLVQQEKLIRSKSRVYRLPDLWMRPSYGGKGRKVTGVLECHQNGFRYTLTRNADQPVDVMFSNIKHAFFQPAERELITILHFHLKNPIMIGKKKTYDVQFYAEVMEVVQSLDNSRRSAYDPDEIEEEQREVARRNKINHEFQTFVKRVQEIWERDFSKLDLEFDIPFKDLGFHGVANRSNGLVIPTTNCLVELVEPPFLVVTLDEIEIVNFERVGFNLKNFDMAIVYKDFSRDVLRVEAIPSNSLDTIKEWLTSVHIKYYESRINLSWKPILKNIISDPEAFISNGGWEFLNLEADDSDEEGEEESDAYEPSEGGDSDDESDDDDSDEDASVVDSDEEDSGSEELDSEEEEGKDWDQLEREAERADRERGDSASDDDRRSSKKRKGGGGGPPAKRGKMPPPRGRR